MSLTPENVTTGNIYQRISQRASTIKKNRDGGCVLALDGGVTTAYSMIVKLEEISNQVASELNLTPAQVPPLCDFLDMVAGVGLGAYIGILIGRLGLTVPDVKKEYLKLYEEVLSQPTSSGLIDEEVLSQPTSSGLIDEEKLDRHLKEVVTKYTGNSETMMFDPDSPTSHCKTFVISKPGENLAYVPKFRSYWPKKGQMLNCPIWQAMRASLAFPGVFPPIEIHDGILKQTYIGAILGTNNPATKAIEEFNSEWKDKKMVALISIGAGHEGVIALPDPSSLESVHVVTRSLATDSEGVAEALERHFYKQEVYFRLSVAQGLQGAAGADFGGKSLAEINTHTRAYLETPSGGLRVVENIVRALTEDPGSRDTIPTGSTAVSRARGARGRGGRRGRRQRRQIEELEQMEQITRRTVRYQFLES